MDEKKTERRSQKRIPTRTAVTIHSHDGSLQATGHTRDLSSNGIFFYSDAKITEGSELEIMLMLPAEFTGGEKRWACCHASVSRVENREDGRQVGLAAKVRRFEVLPEIKS